MPLTGEYAPSPSGWARKQAETFERSGGAEANTLRGKPIVLLTSVGARSGKLRKSPLMRVEHDGEYAVVASQGGAPEHPVWYHNLVAHAHVELQDGPVRRDYTAREAARRRARRLVAAGRGGVARLRRLPAQDRPGHPGPPADTARGRRGARDRLTAPLP